MFKELKIIKLLVIASFFVYIIQASFLKFNVSNYFFSSGSVEMNSSMKLYVASNYSEKDKELVIKDLSENYVQSINVDLKNNLTNDNDNDYLFVGYPLDDSYMVNIDGIKTSGIYMLEDIPFVVKSKEQTDITIVFPYLNNHFYTQSSDGYFFTEEITHLSLNRNIPVDDYTSGMAKYFSYLDSNFSTKYITDLDLENESDYFNSKLVIIYGRSSFWTAKMRQNILKYFNDGGNILLITSQTLDTKLWINKDKNTARTVEVDKEQNKQLLEKWALDKNESPFYQIGLTPKYGGLAINIYKSDYRILLKGHPIFKGLSDETVPIGGRNFMGALIHWADGIPIAEDLSVFDGADLSNLKVEILAYAKCKNFYENANSGIFVVKKDSTSGKIVALGTEDWCLKRNQDKPEINKITRNAIRYLLDEK